jgi:hypothetical protein
MAPFVHLEVAIDRVLSIRFGRNDGDGAPTAELGAQPIVVEGFVGKQGADGDAGDQRFDADAVVSLTRRQGKARQIAERIDKPKSGCRSRQGEPVRAIQSTASRKPRLSRPRRPGSPGLPGSRGAIRSHCASLKIRRIKARLLIFEP